MCFKIRTPLGLRHLNFRIFLSHIDVPRAFPNSTFLLGAVGKGPRHIYMRKESDWLINNTLDSCLKHVFFAKPIYFLYRNEEYFPKNYVHIATIWSKYLRTI